MGHHSGPESAGTPYTSHPAPFTLHPAPFTLHPTPCILHPTPHTPHPRPHTLHPTPYTLHLSPSTPHQAHARGEATQRLWFAPAQDPEGSDGDDPGRNEEGTGAGGRELWGETDDAPHDPGSTGEGRMVGRGVYGEMDDAPHSRDATGEEGDDEDDRWNQGIGVESEGNEGVDAADSAGRRQGGGQALEGEQPEGSGHTPERGQGEPPQPTPRTPHPTPHTLHPTPHTLHPTPCTPHPAPHTPHGTVGGDVPSPAPATPLLPRALHRDGGEDGGATPGGATTGGATPGGATPGAATPGPDATPGAKVARQWGSVPPPTGTELSHRECLYNLFAKVNSRTNPSTYSLYQ